MEPQAIGDWCYIFLLLAYAHINCKLYKVAAFQTPRQPSHRKMSTSEDKNLELSSPASVAFVGNSILYFHDTPRALVNMAGSWKLSRQDSCMRGGASLISLLNDGNGMQRTFSTPNAFMGDDETEKYDIGAPTVEALLSNPWNFVVINDYTQSPARKSSRDSTIRALVDSYVPLFRKCGATPVFVITPAYRRPVNNSTDLGSVAEFTAGLKEGYEAYVKAIEKALSHPIQRPRIAPVGLAFLRIHDTNRPLWEKLFCNDDFHPSPHGTYLQCCVLHWTLFGYAPDRDLALPSNGDLGERIWGNARVMQPGARYHLPLPTAEEANYLFEVAAAVCQEYCVNV
uniref:Uncharacterized protein n=1 Tax=Helicotheca tamesis TaxID=374047 RepID=A0A7S2HM73_9STRA|mmetsp:Transcript_19403/g.26627  ORF Transcript_19403/g.26627 Transcript_19403/m.26627 type:complete len:341 (+) Transcript_19403:63-1085(+)